MSEGSFLYFIHNVHKNLIRDWCYFGVLSQLENHVKHAQYYNWFKVTKSNNLQIRED